MLNKSSPKLHFVPMSGMRLNPARGSGGTLNAVSSYSGVWGGAEIEFGAF